MRILHCADIHLDSPMTTHLNMKQAKERRYELLLAFKRMVKYASDNEIPVIIIAGDLFDSDMVLTNTRNEIIDIIQMNSKIDFYYLEGNHDCGSFLRAYDSIPENLKTFDDKWTQYDIGENVCITGIELSGKEDIYSSLILDKNKFNIVVMHGELRESASNRIANCVNVSTEHISLSKLKNKNIDYLALGHIHHFIKGKIDNRGVYAYSGCLEGRGFDETGEHGFIVIDTELANKSFDVVSFTRFAKRNIYDICVNVSGVNNSGQAAIRIRQELANNNVTEDDMVRVSLTGEIDVNSQIDSQYVERQFQDCFYFFVIKDKTQYSVNPQQFMEDNSLKGEFVRNVFSKNELSPRQKARIIRCGLMALAGEEQYEEGGL